MNELSALTGIVGALLVGTVSPGPTFLVVARAAASRTLSQALSVAFGISVSSVALAAVALAGIQGVLLAMPIVSLVLKLAGGSYLCYLGFQMVRAASLPICRDATSPSSRREPHVTQPFQHGLLTQLSNPKTVVVYAGVFGAFLPDSFTRSFAAAVLVSVFCLEFFWYALIANLISLRGFQQAYLSRKRALDTAAGTVMLILGGKLCVEAGASGSV